ncbi:electron transport complex subunit RsxC [Christensenellaceae bacterium OttesenSCG-928-L17]|nr:electron transport complex subunit RsxC [Christensenellaceae bacterium OttesenSCG-928-L17]
MGSFRGGVHPMQGQHEGKGPTRDKAVHAFVSDSVCIPMGMHLGPPSTPCVKKGDHVRVGQIIGEPVGFLGLPVHASISGEVVDVSLKPLTGEKPVMCVSIQNDFRDEWVDGIAPLGNVEQVDPEKIVPAIKAAGICGMGGATFPTHVKLCIPEGKTCDTIIINGAECETFLTADDRLMRENPSQIIDGLRAVMRALNVQRGVVGIEKNKPEAIAAMQQAARGRAGVEIMPLRVKYPQGGEKQLITAVTGREVPSCKLPIEVNTIVLNVGTAAAIADAIHTGRPLISRVVTVSGCVKTPKNLRLRIGTVVGDAIGQCDGYSETPGKLVLGGGMTGICAANDSVPIVKGTSGIVAYNEADAKSLEETPCIRCGRCVEVCPIGLDPYLLKHYCDRDDMASAKELNVVDCIVCGCCSYACPARRWLTASFKNMKDKVAIASRKEAK